MRVDIRLDATDLKAGIAALKGKFPMAISRALKRAGTSARAEMSRLIVADTGLPSKRVKEEIRVSTVGGVALQLEIVGYRLPLIDFRARGPEPSRGRGKGVSYRLPSGRGRAEHAFIATMRSGHRGVFQRSESARTPIYQLHGPSLVHVFEKFLDQGAKRGTESLTTNLKHEIAYAMREIVPAPIQ